MLQPKRTKYRKSQRGKMKGLAYRGSTLHFGDFGMKALEATWITANQIESVRVSLSRHMKKAGQIWINIFPHKVITKHPQETRMGKGKGAPHQWVAVVKPGRIMFEVNGVPENVAREAMESAARKLPIPVRFVTRETRGGSVL